MNDKPEQLQSSPALIDDIDILPEDMTRRIERTKRQIQALDLLMKEVLKPGVDYMTIPGTPKPTLLQDGAHQICKTFHLQPEFIIEDKTEDRDANPPFLSYVCRCRLYHRPTGMLVSEGIGSANSWESKYRYRWVNAPPEEQRNWQQLKDMPDYRSRKIQGNWTLQRKVANPDVFDIQNTLIKMAKKRAYVDATLNATGASRLFTQDLEDIRHVIDVEEEDSSDDVSSNRNYSRNDSSSGRPATKPQLGLLYKLLGHANLDGDALHQIIQDRFGKQSTTELTTVEASQIIDFLRKVANGEEDASQYRVIDVKSDSDQDNVDQQAKLPF